METLQKTTWTHYLIIGLLISLFGLSNSCKKTRDYAQDGEFNFVNQTNHYISYQKGFEKYNLAPQATVIINQVQDAPGKNVDVNTYSNPFTKEYSYTEPFVIKYNDNRCLTITRSSEHTPLDIKNYNAEKLGERKYKFTYTFTEADYNRAVTCP